ncbi:hypothetical protein [Sedimentitalea sp.]|uniref:hypothetical protein n=1 Tax=Sedimentitalea sp. TaxID=2048915 RepID=UPI003297C6A1
MDIIGIARVTAMNYLSSSILLPVQTMPTAAKQPRGRYRQFQQDLPQVALDGNSRQTSSSFHA